MTAHIRWSCGSSVMCGPHTMLRIVRSLSPTDRAVVEPGHPGARRLAEPGEHRGRVRAGALHQIEHRLVRIHLRVGPETLLRKGAVVGAGALARHRTSPSLPNPKAVLEPLSAPVRKRHGRRMSGAHLLFAGRSGVGSPGPDPRGLRLSLLRRRRVSQPLAEVGLALARVECRITPSANPTYADTR